jgi:NodT family efflux transporter outer membrane factor (OMF) lipoprotein
MHNIRLNVERNKAFLISRTILLSALVSFLFAACTTLGPDFETPDAEVADEWIDIDDPRLKSDSAEYAQWWTAFNDPILDSLITSAYKQNLTLQIVGLRVLEARAQLGIAKGNLYPQVQQARGGATFNTLSESSANTVGPDLNYWDFDAGFDAAWELDFWGKFKRGIESADASLLANMADYDDFLVSLLAEVANAYVIIRTFENRIQLAENNVKLQKRSLRITEVRFQNGATTELDVQQAKTLLRNTQATIPQFETGYRQAKHALSTLLGKPPSELNNILAGANDIPVAPSEVAIGIPAELLRRRPDIRRAELETASQSALIGVAKADLYPSFSLFGSLGLKSSGGTNLTRSGKDGADELFESDSLEFFGGPAFTWNIFNYGRIKNQVRVQDARFQQLVVNYQDTVLRAAREVEDAMIGFLRAQEIEVLLSDSVDAAARSVELALLQYRDGVTDYQRVIDTQTSLVNQQDIWTQSRGAIATNLIAMYKALGGGWQMRKDKDYVSDEMKDTMRERTDWGKILAE